MSLSLFITPLPPAPEYATGWKGGEEGREGGDVVGRPHFEGSSLSSRAFSKLSKIQPNVLDPDPGVNTGSREISKPDPSKITGSATLLKMLPMQQV